MKFIFIALSNLLLFILVKAYKIEYKNIFILNFIFLLLFLNKKLDLFFMCSIMFPFLFLGIVKDYQIMELPDSLFLCLVMSGIIYSLLYKERSYFPLIVLLIDLFIILIMFISKREFIGIGDLKIIFGFSFFLNYKALYYLIFISSVVGLIFGIILKKQKEFPFGPYLIYTFIFLLSIYL